MSLDLLTREKVLVEGSAEGGEETVCIFCQCRPAVSYCGRYSEGPFMAEEWTDDEACPDCFQVWKTTGCPGCGCVRDSQCRMCRPHWWRRWWS